MTSSKITELQNETQEVRSLITDHENIQRDMAQARKETTDFAVGLGMDSNASKNHPSVISFLMGYAKGRTSIMSSILNYIKGIENER